MTQHPRKSGCTWAIAAMAALLVIITYANSLRGEFVYDDTFEIVQNPYVQQGRHFWTAMTSDVWAFRGEGDKARSNYWRPVFVAWMALNYQLFGLDTTGWHVTSILAHIAATLMVLLVLRGLEARTVVCALVTWLFAVHPVHSESVAWASGIPDILMATLVLGSYACVLRMSEKSSLRLWVLALVLYAFALLSKEGAITLPLIVVCTEWIRGKKTQRRWDRLRRGVVRCVPFAVVAIIFVIVRYQILGTMRMTVPGAPTLQSVIATAPSILAFYFRQVVCPYQLGPVYAVRAVNADNWNVPNLVIPLVIVLAVMALAVYVLLRKPAPHRIGLMWFFLPIALALDTRVFLPEQLVHDRYLYLPVFGALLVIVALMTDGLERLFSGDMRRAHRAVLCVGGLATIVLAAVTWRYNPVWGNEIALWERGVRVDPGSAYANGELASQYRRAGRIEEAKRSLERALSIRPKLTGAHIDLGIIAIQEKRYADAERNLRLVLDRFPDKTVAIEQLGEAYKQQGRFDDAIELFDDARRRLPRKFITYTLNIAVLHKLAGKPEAALAELESIRDRLPTADNPTDQKGWLYLGLIYAELGRADESIASLRRFLSATQDTNDPEMRQLRTQAASGLRRLEESSRKASGQSGAGS